MSSTGSRGRCPTTPCVWRSGPTGWRRTTTSSPYCSTEVRPGDDHRAREVAGAAKSATLRELIADSVGAGPVGGRPGSELAAASADLAATYQALEAADTAARRTLLVQQAERLEERVSVLRLREGVRPAAADPASPPFPSVPADSSATELELHVAGDDLILFTSNGPDRSAVRMRGVLPSIATTLDQLSDQWTRFMLGSVFSSRHSDLLLRTTRRCSGSCTTCCSVRWPSDWPVTASCGSCRTGCSTRCRSALCTTASTT